MRRPDHAEFERCVVRHLDSAYNLACWMLRNTHDAEDVVQDSLLKAWNAFGGFRGEDGKAWFFKIVRNGCLKHLEKARVAPVPLVEELVAADHPEAEVLLAFDAEQVHAAIRCLPETYREVLVLREMEQMSYSSISEVVGVPIGTVMSRLSRARAILSKTLVDA